MLHTLVIIAVVSVCLVIPVYLFDKLDEWYNRDIEGYRDDT